MFLTDLLSLIIMSLMLNGVLLTIANVNILH